MHDTLAAMIGSGSAPVRLSGRLVDPEEELIVGGAYDGTLLWKRYEPEYVDIDEALCGQCEAATFARRFLKKRRPAGLPPRLAAGHHLQRQTAQSRRGRPSSLTRLLHPRKTITTRWTPPTTA